MSVDTAPLMDDAVSVPRYSVPLWIPVSVAAWLVATETTHALRDRLP